MSAVETAPRVPAPGTKLRRLYDILILGHPVSTERAVAIFGRNGSAQAAIVVLRTKYALDIRSASRGMWKCFGRSA